MLSLGNSVLAQTQKQLVGNYPFCEFGEKSLLRWLFFRGEWGNVDKWFEGVLADEF